MELRHLRYFVMVAEELNVSRAAARLHVSQPAISRQLKDLEEELGGVLFVRSSTGMALSGAGEAFLGHARDILRRARLAVESVRAATGRTPVILTVGYIPTALPSLLGQVLRRFAVKHPDVSVELRESSPHAQVEQLRAGLLDIALVGNPHPGLRDEFEVRTVLRIPVAAVVPDDHRLARRRAVDLAELADDPFVGLAKRTFPGRNEFICETCQRVGFTPRFVANADSLSSMLGLVAAGRGVTLMPADGASLPHPGVVFARLRRPKAFVESAVAWSAHRSSPASTRFIEALERTHAPARRASR